MQTRKDHRHFAAGRHVRGLSWWPASRDSKRGLLGQAEPSLMDHGKANEVFVACLYQHSSGRAIPGFRDAALAAVATLECADGTRPHPKSTPSDCSDIHDASRKGGQLLTGLAQTAVRRARKGSRIASSSPGSRTQTAVNLSTPSSLARP